jgi:hypothetical protein
MGAMTSLRSARSSTRLIPPSPRPLPMGLTTVAPPNAAIAEHGETIRAAIPPRSTAVSEETTDPPGQRDRHRALMQEKGRLAWQAAAGYGKRALVETMMGCCAWMAKGVQCGQSIKSPYLRCRINTTPRNVTTLPEQNTPSLIGLSTRLVSNNAST